LHNNRRSNPDEGYRILARRDGTLKTTTTDKRTRSPTPEELRTSQEALHTYVPFTVWLGMFRIKTDLEDAAFCTQYP
jgi:(p)ppGpp synthase/HD superfamily hydrolase